MASPSNLLSSLLAVLIVASASISVAHGCGINILNSCSYPVTTCAQSGSNPVSQYQIGAGASQYLNFGSACSWPSAAIYASITGNCQNPDRPLANLAEFNIASPTDYYDLSNVNAYTIGLGISVISSAGGDCGRITCSIPNIRSFCQGDNVLISEPSGALSCINTDGPGLVPTPYTNLFNTACSQAYSYSKDDGKVRTCGHGSSYQVQFCP